MFFKFVLFSYQPCLYIQIQVYILNGYQILPVRLGKYVQEPWVQNSLFWWLTDDYRSLLSRVCLQWINPFPASFVLRFRGTFARWLPQQALQDAHRGNAVLSQATHCSRINSRIQTPSRESCSPSQVSPQVHVLSGQSVGAFIDPQHEKGLRVPSGRPHCLQEIVQNLHDPDTLLRVPHHRHKQERDEQGGRRFFFRLKVFESESEKFFLIVAREEVSLLSWNPQKGKTNWELFLFQT